MALSLRCAFGAGSRPELSLPDDALKWIRVERGAVKGDDPGSTAAGHAG